VLKTILSKLLRSKWLSSLFLKPVYVLRFVYHGLKEDSLLFSRYYPGYHGSTIPSLKWLKTERDRIFSQCQPGFDGIQLRKDEQYKLLEQFARYYKEFNPDYEKNSGRLYFYNNDMFGFGDAFFLYCILRHFKPTNVIEVGSGHSSALMLDTANECGHKTTHTFIDPYSTTIGLVLANKPAGQYSLIRQEIQFVDPKIYESLGENDVLFIDSSHVVKIGSDLTTLLFTVLPVLPKGVIVHIHDIWYPWEYPENFLVEGRAYNEIYFVRAFLQFNSDFEIMFFNSFVEQEFTGFILEAMPRLTKDTGKGLWLRKIN
jgi:hypothetical protein